MSITIIIPTINEPTLNTVIQAAKKELSDAEIIVVGYGSSKEIASKNSVRFLDTGKKTPKPIGINMAVRMATNNWIVVLDADAIPQSGWGYNMLSAFQQGKRIFNSSVDISKGNFWMKAYNFSCFHEFLPENAVQERQHLPAISLGFTKDVFELGGGWDETLVRSQDYEWTLRLFTKGIILWFEPKAVILHVPTSQNTFQNLWKAWERNGYYNWLVRKKYSQVLGTPKILDYPILVLLFAPALAIVPTMRILRTSPRNFIKYFYLLPFVYLTKVAWCWGVYKASTAVSSINKSYV